MDKCFVQVKRFEVGQLNRKIKVVRKSKSYTGHDNTEPSCCYITTKGVTTIERILYKEIDIIEASRVEHNVQSGGVYKYGNSIYKQDIVCPIRNNGIERQS